MHFTQHVVHMFYGYVPLPPSLQIGTYQIAVMAKALNKPFYVVAESFKFVRMFPLKQEDLPNQEKVSVVV